MANRHAILGAGPGIDFNNIPFYSGGFDEIILVDRNYPEKTMHANVIYLNTDILKFLEGCSLQIDYVHAYRILEHFSPIDNSLFYLLYCIYRVMPKGGKLIGVVPDFEEVTKSLNLYTQDSTHYHVQLLKIHTEIFNTKNDPHQSVWTEKLVKYYIEREKYFKVTALAKHFRMDNRDWYIYFEAERI